MATVREGDGTVLLVVDVQVDVVRDAWDAPRVTANVALAVPVPVRDLDFAPAEPGARGA